MNTFVRHTSGPPEPEGGGGGGGGRGAGAALATPPFVLIALAKYFS